MNLTQLFVPETTFFPGLLEGDLLLTYESTSSSSAASGISSGSGSGGDGTGSEEGSYGGGVGGVVWRVDATVSDATMMTWTIFPSTGLLRPQEK